MSFSTQNSLESRVGPYEILGLLGEGGMGQVYLARHVATGQRVAVKVVRTPTPEYALALRMEIAALRAVQHPNIVMIEDEGIDRGLPWYAMELLSGTTLAGHNRALWERPFDSMDPGSTEAVARTAEFPRSSTGGEPALRDLPPGSPMRIEASLRLYRRLCEPLAYIHGRGIVHQDLKPTNVFIRGSDDPVLMDFGLFSYANGGLGREVLEAGERAFGAYHYVAPERVEGRSVDARADLYALGCMLFETLTGRPPFVGGAREVVRQHVDAPPPALSHLVGDVPAGLDQLVQRLLAKSPHDRIGRAGEVAAALGALLGDRPARAGMGASPTSLHRPELSGRADVLAILDTHTRAALRGKGSFVLVRGESGIGKTFLVSDFTLHAARAGFRVVTGECVAHVQSSATATPLHALRRLLQSIGDVCHTDVVIRQRVLRGRAAHLAPFEPGLDVFAQDDLDDAPETLPGHAGSERVVAVLSEAVRELARTTPLLLAVDDLQWADNLTLDFFAGLDRAFFDDLPLLIVATFRSEEAPPHLASLARSNACTTLSLGRLEPHAVREMVCDMLGAETPPDGLVASLAEQSEGNPFFVAEYLRYVVGAGLLWRSHEGWRLVERSDAGGPADAWRPPRSLEELVTRRLGALHPSAQATIRAAAVLGRTFELRALEAVLGLPADELLPLLRQAQDRDVLEETQSGFRFSHDKLRESAYAAIPAAERAPLHARAAATLEAQTEGGGGRAAEVARHHKLSGSLRRALALYERAGEDAAAKSAHKDAAVFFREALELSNQVGDVPAETRARWHRELGAALADSGEIGEGRSHIERSIRLLGGRMPASTPALAKELLANAARQVKHRLLPRRSIHQDWRRQIDLARAFDRLQQLHYYSGDGPHMLYACLASLNLSETAPASPELTVAYANAHAVAGVLPAPWLVRVYCRRALDTMRSAPDPVAETYFLMLSGVYLTGVGRWADAAESLERGLAIAQQLSFGRRVRETTGALGILHYFQGEFSAARARADALHEVAFQKDAHTQCWALLSRAQVLLVYGENEAALRDAEVARPLAAQLGRPERAWCLSLECAARARLGDVEAADAVSRRAIEEIRAAPPVTHYTIGAHALCAETRLAVVRARAGRPQADRPTRDALRALTRVARVFPVAQPRSHLVEGFALELGGDRRRARDAYRKALAAAERLAMPYDRARAELALAAVEGRGEQARTRAVLDALGADVRSARFGM
jgi:serine/threonine protein kinase/tetratricopeptide (TPR) repeat protein